MTTVDGTSQLVTVTINGSNDAAIISGDTTGSVIETERQVRRQVDTPTVTGTLTDCRRRQSIQHFHGRWTRRRQAKVATAPSR